MPNIPVLAVFLMIMFILSFIYNNKIYIIIFILHYKKKVPWYSDLPFNKKSISLSTTEWLSEIKDETDIRDLSIPGTHDSATSKFEGCCQCWINFMSQVQSWSIEDQLISGIRYFDLRPAGDGFVYHGAHKTIYTFDGTFNIFKQFLNEHKKEFLIVRVYFQEKNYGNDIEECKKNVIYSVFDKMNDLIYNDDNYDNFNVGKVRGKIILILQKLSYQNCLIWDEESDFFQIQDYYNFFGTRGAEIEKKKTLVKKYMFSQENKKLIINHCSAIGRGVLTTLRFVAYSINQMPFEEKGYKGIFAFDFPGEGLIQHVIEQNKNYMNNNPNVIENKENFKEVEVV